MKWLGLLFGLVLVASAQAQPISGVTCVNVPSNGGDVSNMYVTNASTATGSTWTAVTSGSTASVVYSATPNGSQPEPDQAPSPEKVKSRDELADEAEDAADDKEDDNDQ